MLLLLLLTLKSLPDLLSLQFVSLSESQLFFLLYVFPHTHTHTHTPQTHAHTLCHSAIFALILSRLVSFRFVWFGFLFAHLICRPQAPESKKCCCPFLSPFLFLSCLLSCFLLSRLSFGLARYPTAPAAYRNLASATCNMYLQL